MNYFAGLGQGRGWEKLQFFISADELLSIFNLYKMFLVIDNRRVPLNYIATKMQQYVKDYKLFVEHIIDGKKIDTILTTALYTAITYDVKTVSSQKCPDTRYKFFKPLEPIIQLNPCMLLYQYGRLRQDVFSANSFYFGLSMSFPKVIVFDDNGMKQDTSKFPNRALFDVLQNTIEKMTKNCVFISPQKQFRTKIRISDAVYDAIKRNGSLANIGLSLL